MENLRVLLIEDDPGLSLLFQRMLTRLGHCAADSVPLEGAIVNEIRQLLPDLLLIDVTMSDAVEALELAHAVTSTLGTQVLLISNCSLEQLAERHASASRYHFLRKPFFVKDLAHAISRVRSHPSNGSARQEDETVRSPKPSDARRA
jgi:DNA-binding NtrC family response regulator